MRLIYIILLVLPLVFESVSSSHLIKSLTKRQACNSCNTCNSGNCNSGCSGSSCCSSCNSCVNTCSNSCQTQVCQNNCVNSCASSCNKCETTTPTTPTRPVPIIISRDEHEAAQTPIYLNNTVVNLANHTANINIENAINNTNIIHVPIFVNTTNYNNINIQQEESSQPVIPSSNNVEVIKIIERQNFTEKEKERERQDDCCYILHPRKCEVINGERKCYIGRHLECGDVCRRRVIQQQIIPQPIIIRQPPIIRQPIIQVVRQPCTGQYCGTYQPVRVSGCEGCYSCANQGTCPQTATCGEECSRYIYN